MITCPDGVRAAVPEDRFALLDLVRQWNVETGYGPLDDLIARQVIWRGVWQQDAVIGVIGGKPGERIEGSIGLFLVPLAWYSRDGDDKVCDLWNFVSEPYRRTTHAKKLLEYAKFASSHLNRPLMMTMPQNEGTLAKFRLYERQLPKDGAVFLFNPSAVADQPATA